MTQRFTRVDAAAELAGCEEMAKDEIAENPRLRQSDYYPFVAGAMQAQYRSLAAKYNALLDAFAAVVAESDTPFEVAIDNGRITEVKTYPELSATGRRKSTPIIHGTAHVTVPPPWPLPKGVQAALDASARGMLGDESDDDDERASIPLDSTVLTDDDLVRIVGTIGRDARAFVGREAS